MKDDWQTGFSTWFRVGQNRMTCAGAMAIYNICNKIGAGDKIVLFGLLFDGKVLNCIRFCRCTKS